MYYGRQLLWQMHLDVNPNRDVHLTILRFTPSRGVGRCKLRFWLIMTVKPVKYPYCYAMEPKQNFADM